MTTRMVTFNINDCVRVKLTPHGHEIVRKRYEKLKAALPVTANFKFTPPKEDSDGWSRWQVWSLMETFGEHVGLALPIPFKTSMEFEVKEGRDGE